MLEFLTRTETAVPVEEDPAVSELLTRLESRQHEYERAEAEEAALKHRLDPAPNAPTTSEVDRHEALTRLEVVKGSTRSWFLPERVALRDEIASLRMDLDARRAEARAALDAIRREARKPLVAEVVAALEGLIDSHERLLAFDKQWDEDRAGGRDVPARTPMTTITRAEVESVRAILDAQGWLS